MPQTLDMLYAVDFMTQYGKTFGIPLEPITGVRVLPFLSYLISSLSSGATPRASAAS